MEELEQPHNIGREKGGPRTATKARNAMRHVFETRFARVADELFDTYLGLALGEREGGVDKPKYTRLPDREVLKHVIDQGIGRASQSMELDHEGEVSYVIKRAGDSGAVSAPKTEEALPSLEKEDDLDS